MSPAVEETLELEDQVDNSEVELDDVEETVQTTTTTTKKKTSRPRKYFYEKNQYYFEDLEAAKTALSEEKICYGTRPDDDGNQEKLDPVPGLRVFVISKGGEVKDGEEQFTPVEAAGYVVMNTPAAAVEKFLEQKLGLTANFMFPKKRGGATGARGPRKVDATHLQFGQMLIKYKDWQTFKDTFGPGSSLEHTYKNIEWNEDGSVKSIEWKEPK